MRFVMIIHSGLPHLGLNPRSSMSDNEILDINSQACSGKTGVDSDCSSSSSSSTLFLIAVILKDPFLYFG